MNNQLLVRLDFKTLLIPSWFGISVEEWMPLQDILGEFLHKTIMTDVVDRLLNIENSPQYWMECQAWPYPDSHYYNQLCAIIDGYAPDHWGLEVRTFWFAYIIQHIRQWIMGNMDTIYQYRLQQQ